jgi:S-adenosylmethionine synthetase
MKRLSSAESVCKGHPDKLCDFISDSILDACLEKDPESRVACEVMATKGHIFVAGETTCAGNVNFRYVVALAIAKAGYDPDDFKIKILLHNQSRDIAHGVDNALESRQGDTSDFSRLGAGDQGTVYGYATDETRSCLPIPLVLAHSICSRIDTLRETGVLHGYMPDGKAQVTIEYEDDKPVRVSAVVVSVQHQASKRLEDLKKEMVNYVLLPAFQDFPFDENTQILINPSGRFVEGGPAADTGLTGRKIMVDTYGGLALHGGGAFSGKDPTKVDRSGAYMARFIAKNIVCSGLATRCEVGISYAIGKADPVSVSVKAFGTCILPDCELVGIVRKVFNLRPGAVISSLGLRDVRYADTSCYGHFSSRLFPWEDGFAKVPEILEAVKNNVD